MVLQSRAAYHGDKMLTLFTWGYWGWGTLKEFGGLPWGSVVTLQAGEQVLPIVSGPAKYRGEWCLQVVRPGNIGSDPEQLKRWGAKFRKSKGLEYRRL